MFTRILRYIIPHGACLCSFQSTVSQVICFSSSMLFLMCLGFYQKILYINQPPLKWYVISRRVTPLGGGFWFQRCVSCLILGEMIKIMILTCASFSTGWLKDCQTTTYKHTLYSKYIYMQIAANIFRIRCCLIPKKGLGVFS